jgi:RNA polymerase-binding protein DksA
MHKLINAEELLQELRADYVKRLSALRKDTHHMNEPVEKDFAEQVVQRENDDVLNALDQETKSIIMRIDNALLRIQSGEYGMCLRCGCEIPIDRLRAIPYAEHCVNCAEDIVEK